ncbi:facilitated trehalose transporter Tret1-2 homolog isoform X2 [Eurytemora carolleeae]|uniref:facilitated trehalose transporter Tret1-2 homolog isoform X2 n=1 Tax=Eurytemora carolleeae TaxID=1294199 RepID=UPI000C78AA50|nr:facilitated trehalose transporter Tret1-2 homolog isoform X2 [Eurytemora carolleeae]|eukprot:XP_023342693.1 facilitated trehalose transporter Tret1-2 homolog isoform X2 [Eurytemora affinis]
MILNFPQLRKIWPQVFATLISSMAYLTVGIMRSWAATAVPSLNKPELRGEINEWALATSPQKPEIISWIVSTLPLGAICGSLISSFPLNYLGRRPTLILAGTIFIIANLLIGLAQLDDIVPMILVGRVMGGIGVGITMPATVIYISETTHSSLRGRLGCIPALLLALGVLLGYAIGAGVAWHQLAYISLIPPGILILGMCFLPESPVWLTRNGKVQLAIKSSDWFNLENESTKPTAPSANSTQEKENTNTTEDNGKLEEAQAEQQEITQKFISRGVLHPLSLSMVLMFLQSWSGINVLVFKTVEIFNAVGSSIDDYVATAVVGIVQLVATGGSVVLADKAGRRILLMISSLVMTVSIGILGLCFYLKGSEPLMPDSIGWLPLVCIILAFIGFSVGFGPIPFLIMGELFPARYRNILGSISSVTNLTTLFFLLRFFTDMTRAMTFHGVFWLYTAINLAGFFFVFFFLPETKGRNLAEIEDHFSGRKKMNSA